VVEYGHGVGSGPAGQVGGSSGGFANGGGDWGGQIANAAGDAVQQIQALPPGQLLLLIAAIVVGFWILRRAF
jgi:hypothetical protein